MEDRTSDKSELPKRLRYYTSLSDDKNLKSGKDYMHLPDFVTMTISSYDPFNADAMYYEARTVLTTHPHIEYKDGILHIFLYCKGKLNKELNSEHGKKLMELLKYILSGEKPTSENNDIEVIDNIVSQVKKKPEVTISYMQQWDRENHIRRDAKAEDALVLIRLGRKHNIPDDELYEQIRDELELPEYIIQDLFKQINDQEKIVSSK